MNGFLFKEWLGLVVAMFNFANSPARLPNNRKYGVRRGLIKGCLENMQKMSKLKEIIENNFDSLSLLPGEYMLEYDENQSIHCNNDYAICLRINNTGDLCPPPHGNFTFSDLPIVKRNGQTDHVSVAWTYQVDQRILKSSAFFVCKLNYSDTIEFIAVDS